MRCWHVIYCRAAIRYYYFLLDGIAADVNAVSLSFLSSIYLDRLLVHRVLQQATTGHGVHYSWSAVTDVITLIVANGSIERDFPPIPATYHPC